MAKNSNQTSKVIIDLESQSVKLSYKRGSITIPIDMFNSFSQELAILAGRTNQHPRRYWANFRKLRKTSSDRVKLYDVTA